MQAIVHEVLRSPGEPLDAATLSLMEGRFGHDFGHVRVHTDAPAAESAQALGSLAYTLGRHIVFGAGRYAPQTASGQRLLAHELTHVVQQVRNTGPPGRLEVAGLDSAPEREARRSEAAIPQGCFGGSASRTPPVIALQPAPILVRPPVPVRPPPRRIPGGRARPDPETYPRYAPYPTTLEEAFERAAEVAKRERAIFELERPNATLERGGSPPNFITDRGEGLAMGTYGTVRYRRRDFHILDAIEYEVGRASTEADLTGILMDSVPEWVPPDRAGLLFYPRLVPRRFPWVTIPRNLDPGGVVRLGVYQRAVAARIQAVPSLKRARTIPAEGPAEGRRRGCVFQPAAGMSDECPIGNDPLAALYCQYATGGLFEVRVTSPRFGSVMFDSLVGDTAYECKCGYGALVRAARTGRRSWADLRLDCLDEQMRRQSRIASDCALRYRYVVSNPDFAALLTDRWIGSIAVMHVGWEPCG